MKIPSGGGGGAKPAGGAANASSGIDKSGAAAAALETGGNCFGLVIDAIGNQVGHEKSMMAKGMAATTSQVNMQQESSANITAASVSRSDAQVKALRSSLL